MALENILSQEIVQKLGWTLLHFVWQAAAAALLLTILLAVLRKSSANLRYIVTCAALGLIVLLPIVTMQLVSVSTPQPAANIEPAPSPAPVILPAQEIREIPALEITVQEEPVRLEITDTALTASWKQQVSEKFEPALPYIVSAWLLGVFGLSLWHLGGWAQLQRLRKKMIKQVDDSFHIRLRQLSEKLRVKQTVQLAESALVQVPTVVGWLRPVILLPASALTGLTTEQLESLLAHELAHIRRYDYLVNMLQTVVETLGFYHPAVWWVSHKIRIERENCCDDLAVSISGDRIRYARALTSMEEIRGRHGSLAVAAAGGNLFGRIRRLVGKDSTEPSRTSWIPSAITILLIAIIAIPTTLALTAKSESQESELGTNVSAEPQETDSPVNYGPNRLTSGETRIVLFPEDRSLGGLYVRDSGIEGRESWEGWQELGPARGEISVSQGKELKLEVSEKTFENLADLAAIRANDIQNLYIRYRNLQDSDLVHLKGLTGLQSITLSSGSPAHPCSMNGEGLVNLSGMESLRVLMIQFTSIRDESLVHLKHLTNLENLLIWNAEELTGKGLSHLRDMPSLRYISFYMVPIEDFGLENLKGMSQLERLSLQYTKVTDEGLIHLKGLTGLKELVLPPDTTDAGLAKLQELSSLEELYISDTKVTDDGLSHLKGLSGLQSLSVGGRNMNGRGLKHLNDLPRLKELSIFMNKMDDEGMKGLKGLTSVTSLNLALTQVSDGGLANIAELNTLKYLSLKNTSITDAGMTHLNGLTSLETLDMEGTQITDAGLTNLRGLASLQTLWLQGTDITDAGLMYLKGLQSLNELYLSHTQVSDAGLVNLKELHSLQYLFLDGTNVSGEGLAHLKDMKLLRELGICVNNLSEGGVGHLKEMTWLHELTLGEGSVSEATVANLRKALPDCIIDVQEVPSRPPRPKRVPPSLVGKSLPGLKDLGIVLSLADSNEKIILVCFFDMNQRPSRNLIGELAKREKELAEKNVTVYLVHTSNVEPAKLKEWLNNQNIPFTCGSIEKDAEKVLFRWGVRAQPWLILTDEEGVVQAGGFGLDSLTPEGLERLLEPAKSKVPFYYLKHTQPEKVAESLKKILAFRAANSMYPKSNPVVATSPRGTNVLTIAGNEQEVQVAMSFITELDMAGDQTNSGRSNVRIYVLYHTDPEEVAELLQFLLTDDVVVNALPDQPAKKIVVMASESDHERIERLIRLLDVLPEGLTVGEESIAAKPKPGITIPKGFDELVKRREGAKNARMGSADQEQRSRDNLPVEESAINNSRDTMLAKSAAPSSVDKSIVKVDLSVVEVPPDSKMDTETIITIRNLLAGKITVSDSPNAADLLRKAAEATAAVKDESAGDKRVTQEQFKTLFDLLASRGYIKILMNPRLQVVDGQTAKILSSQKVPLDKATLPPTQSDNKETKTEYEDVTDSIQITPNVLEDGNIILQVNLDLSLESPERGKEQPPIINKRQISTRICLSPGESGIIGGMKQAGRLTEPGNAVKDLEVPATEMLVILTPTIVPTVTEPPKQPQPGTEAKESPANKPVTRVYDISDFVLVGARISRGRVDVTMDGSGGMIGRNLNIPDQAFVNEAQKIVNLIMQTIAPNSWYENNPNANGTITPFPAASPRKLAIYQTLLAHQQIEKLLKSRREQTYTTQISIELRYLYTNVEFLDEVRDSMDIEFKSDTFLNDKQVETLLRASQKSRDIRSLMAPRATVLNNETARFSIAKHIFMSFLGYSEQNNVSQQSTPVPINTFCTITPHIEDNKNIIIDFVQDISGLQERIIYDQREMVQSYTETTAITNKRIPNNKTFAFTCDIIKFDQDNQTALPDEKKTLIILIKPTIIVQEEMPRSEATATILNSQRSKSYTAEQSDETILLKSTKEEQPGIGKSRILIDTRILTISDEFMRYIGLDLNSVTNSKGWSDYLIHTTDDSTSFVIDQLHEDLLLRTIAARMRTHKDIQMLHKPQVLAASGKKCEIHIVDESEYYMLAPPSEPNGSSDGPESKINHIELGTTIRLTPNLTPDRKNVELDFEWEYRRLRGVKEHTGPDGNVQKVPQIAVESIKTPCTVPDGNTLLIITKKITEEVEVESKTSVLGNLPLVGGFFHNNSKTSEEKTLLIMVTPRTYIKKPLKPQTPRSLVDPNDPLIKQLEEKFNRSAKPK